MKLLTQYIKGYSRLVSYSLITGILNRFLSVGIVVFSSYMVGLAISGGSSAEVKNLFIPLIALGLAKALAAYLEMYFVHDLAYSILYDYRNITYKKLSELSPPYLLKERTGNIAATIMEDIEQLEVFYAHIFTAYIVSIVASIILSAVAYTIHPKLLLVIIPGLLIILVIPYLFLKPGVKIGNVLRFNLGELNAEIIDSIQGIKEILSFNQRESFLEKINNKSVNIGRIQLKEGIRAGLQGAIIVIVLTTVLFMISLIANQLYLSGAIGKKWIPSITILALYILGPAVGISNTAASLGVVEAASKRIMKILTEVSTVEDDVPYEKIPKLIPSVSFEDVSFYYEKDKTVLDQLSFNIAPYENVVLVGESGAGKSTCFYLLMRFWNTKNGQIKIGNRNINQMSIQNLREQIAYVSQDIYLFNTTIKENIKLGNPNADDQSVIAAAKLALADEFIRAMPDGYNTIIGERGAKLSGGQKQRLAIARALLYNAPIILFDEAVSNLDAKSEKIVETAIQNISEGKTIITIAHRLSTIKNAQRIIFISNGKICDEGKHYEILERNAAYKKLLRAEY